MDTLSLLKPNSAPYNRVLKRKQWDPFGKGKNNTEGVTIFGSEIFMERINEIKFSTHSQKEFYKDKPLINLVLKLYFLPLNLFKYILYLKAWHYYQMMDKEIEMLRKEMNDEGN